jgi:hypothetical protein
MVTIHHDETLSRWLSLTGRLVMSESHDARARPSYENVTVACPHCGHENVYNRASDLRTFKHLDREKAICLKCSQPFSIISDYVGEKHEYLIYDCYELEALKKYMYCIINLCVACEAFFMKAIETKLLWEPWKAKVFRRDTGVFNDYCTRLHDKAGRYPYGKLRNVFLDLYVYDKVFTCAEDIDQYVDNISSFASKPPKDEEISEYQDQQTRTLLLQLKRLTINEARNGVAHKYAYRPTRQDVEKHLDEVRSVVFGLQAALKLKHQESYIN